MPSNFIINLLNNQDPRGGNVRKVIRKLTPIVKFLFYFLLASAVVMAVFSFNITFSDSILSKNYPAALPWEKIKEALGVRESELRDGAGGRINILLLGIGGEGHDGPYLTDTIVLLSIDPAQKRAALLSIPRDLYVPIPGYGWRKINEAVALGDAKNPGEGEMLLSRVINDIFGLPVNYYVRVDFEAFEQLVDIVGGVDVYVDNDLIDYTYPATGREDAEPYNARFESLVIKKGDRHLDGDLALRYIRSRHALGAEGNDFARAARQQKVLLALKEKILSFEFLLQPQKVFQILSALREHVLTNLDAAGFIRLAQTAEGIDAGQTVNKVLDTGAEGPLYAATSSEGAYILKTKTGDFSQLAEIAQNLLPEENKEEINYIQ